MYMYKQRGKRHRPHGVVHVDKFKQWVPCNLLVDEGGQKRRAFLFLMTTVHVFSLTFFHRGRASGKLLGHRLEAENSEGRWSTSVPLLTLFQTQLAGLLSQRHSLMPGRDKRELFLTVTALKRVLSPHLKLNPWEGSHRIHRRKQLDSKCILRNIYSKTAPCPPWKEADFEEGERRESRTGEGKGGQ